MILKTLLFHSVSLMLSIDVNVLRAKTFTTDDGSTPTIA